MQIWEWNEDCSSRCLGLQEQDKLLEFLLSEWHHCPIQKEAFSWCPLVDTDVEFFPCSPDTPFSPASSPCSTLCLLFWGMHFMKSLCLCQGLIWGQDNVFNACIFVRLTTNSHLLQQSPEVLQVVLTSELSVLISLVVTMQIAKSERFALWCKDSSFYFACFNHYPRSFKSSYAKKSGDPVSDKGNLSLGKPATELGGDGYRLICKLGMRFLEVSQPLYSSLKTILSVSYHGFLLS